MNTKQLKSEISKLPLSEQVSLLDSLWVNIQQQQDALSTQKKTELKERYQMYEQGKMPVHDCQNAHKALREKYQ